MSEHDAINGTPHPATVDTLIDDFKALGLEPGMTVIVHSSLSKMGWVCGGAMAVILALEKVLSHEGTLVMPTHSGDLSDPAEWQNPPVPEVWWQVIRDTMPSYDPDLTVTRGMGVIPETFRKQRGTIRSAHPQTSFAAHGKHAEWITANHLLNSAMGDNSPLGRIYELNGWVLLLGVPHDNNTSLHLAEYRGDWPGKHTVQRGAPVLVNGESQWVWFEDVNTDADDFGTLGEAFNQTPHIRRGKVAQADVLFFRQRAAVDFAIEWLETHRSADKTYGS